ncbi:hypothetical protein RI054_40g146740 [Pseudoscourfieldia marina]
MSSTPFRAFEFLPTSPMDASPSPGTAAVPPSESEEKYQDGDDPSSSSPSAPSDDPILPNDGDHARAHENTTAAMPEDAPPLHPENNINNNNNDVFMNRLLSFQAIAARRRSLLEENEQKQSVMQERIRILREQMTTAVRQSADARLALAQTESNLAANVTKTTTTSMRQAAKLLALCSKIGAGSATTATAADTPTTTTTTQLAQTFQRWCELHASVHACKEQAANKESRIGAARRLADSAMLQATCVQEELEEACIAATRIEAAATRCAAMSARAYCLEQETEMLTSRAAALRHP